MPKAYSLDLRQRVARFVEGGRSCHAAAAHFSVSVSFVVRLMKLFARPEGSLPSRAADAATPSLIRIGRFCSAASPKSDIIMPELSAELAAASGTKADPASLSRRLIRNGYRFKKNPAGERARSPRRQSGARGMDHHTPAANAA